MNIKQGDCMVLMQELQARSIDAIITDPPYGIDYQSARRTDTERFAKIKADKEPALDWLAEAYRVLKEGGCLICFCRWDVEDAFYNAIKNAGFSVKSQVIWDRVVHGLGDLNGQFAPQHYIIWFATKGSFSFQNGRSKSVLTFIRVDPDKMLHPNEKPVRLMRYLVERLTKKGDIVLDPFMGSGSTGIACKHLEREFIGFELDEGYYNIASKRMDEAKKQVTLNNK